MYIIESLKKAFPAIKDELDIYDGFLRAEFPETSLGVIFNDEKENYHLAQEAFTQLDAGNREKFVELITKYSRSMHDDPDFLRHFMASYFGDDTDTSKWGANKLRNYVKDKLNKEHP